MQTYLVMRRGAWESAEELDAASAVASQVEDEDLGDQLKWIRSYVLEEEDGSLGTVCIYQAEDDDVIMEHAQRAELPVDEVVPVVDTVVFRDDP